MSRLPATIFTLLIFKPLSVLILSLLSSVVVVVILLLRHYISKFDNFK